MKKLLMAVAAVFAVVSMASASKINWGGDNAILDNNGNPMDGGTAYLVYLGSNGTLDATFNGTSWEMGDDQVVDSTAILGQAGYPSSSSVWGNFGASSMVSTSAGSVYTIIATDKGVTGTSLPTEGYFGTSATFTQTKDGAMDQENFQYAGTITANTAITPVPEPTTYALIGIAAAALALRKRFLKK